MLLANYASDSGSEDEAGPSTRPAPKPVAAAAAASSSAIAGTSNTAGPSASKGKKRTGPIKITLDLPKSISDEKREEDEHRAGGSGEDSDGERSGKRVKTGPQGGKGSSSLLGMLPPPKRKLPSSAGSAPLKINKSMVATKPTLPASSIHPGGSVVTEEIGDDDEDEPLGAGSNKLLPPSMARKAKQDKKETSLDLFGLATAPTPSPSTTSNNPSSLPPQITSAPAVSDFIPPIPTPSDPYPGYYLLPNGQWAAYDPDYYHSFFSTKDSAADREAYEEEAMEGGKIGKHWSDFDGSAEITSIQAGEGLGEAKKEEERRQLAKPKKVADGFEYKAIGQVKGLASERHQLTSLLNTAFTKRDELEDRISSNKKNARMAKSKYGF